MKGVGASYNWWFRGQLVIGGFESEKEYSDDDDNLLVDQDDAKPDEHNKQNKIMHKSCVQVPGIYVPEHSG